LHHFKHGLAVPQWKYNYNYWTGGLEQRNGDSWTYCNGTANIPFLVANFSWGSDKRSKDCAMVKITKDKGVTLNDRSCKDKYIAACEVENIIKGSREKIILLYCNFKNQGSSYASSRMQKG
jgi:Lectin C-type domain